MDHYIVLRGHGSISCLGHDKEGVRQNYKSGLTNFQMFDNSPVAALQAAGSEMLEQLVQEKKAYRGLDRSVLMAIYASRLAVADAGWSKEKNISINIGSSRGATGLFEHYISGFHENGIVPPNTSPVTTLGNISSWVGQDLNSSGPVISHSVTCSTGLQAIANGFAWLKSGMAEKFLAGASEAPLTPFTIAQMRSLGIYSEDKLTPYPCRPFNAEKRNTFVLGEAAVIFALERLNADEFLRERTAPIILESVGFGFEDISTKTGISRQGNHFKKAIQNALDNANSSLPIDLIIMHAPGTLAGDRAELEAIRSVFGDTDIPVLSSSKWMTGHALGASGCLSLDYAINILQTQSYLQFPYSSSLVKGDKDKSFKRILVSAAGFGGNATSVIISNV